MEQVPLADWQTLKSGYYVAQPGICSKISGFLVQFVNLRGEDCAGIFIINHNDRSMLDFVTV